MNTLLKIGKWYWLLIFVIVIFIEVEQISNYYLRFYRSHIPLLLFIGLLIFHRNWLSWLFFIFICAFGLYNLFTWGLIASSATSMEFNYYLRHGLDGYPYRRIASLLTAPEFFYFFSLIVFFTKPVRKKYFKPEKRGSEESILTQSS